MGNFGVKHCPLISIETKQISEEAKVRITFPSRYSFTYIILLLEVFLSYLEFACNILYLHVISCICMYNAFTVP